MAVTLRKSNGLIIPQSNEEQQRSNKALSFHQQRTYHTVLSGIIT